MFTHFKNIDTAFRHIRTFSLFLILANMLIVCFSLYKSYQLTEQAQNKVFILYNGKVLEAVASDRKSNLPVELRDHIRTFHQYFFSLSPDEKAIQATVSRALYLADESAKKQYDNLRESGYYNNLIAANISQEIDIDSIRLDVDNYPYRFTCFSTQKLIRSSSTAIRKLITQGLVRDLKSQTDNNPHGFLIQNWEIIENK
ncbi:conjugative transposon TraK protein [Arcticibacter tournemirensis]|uniref:Conjugative transposon protein TraK n=1 Tax=Arcticibacter tournemirensis TaxID=699437 RepID=A0A5M9H4M4_9SPHI|nr:conjugative transposon protein TraK [Arcticibacter tournemirensis]KAA8480078.1 conjugative transposon protein TraK [Arcticibacter tournemirensis]TQM50680.1 conjugative transposon TraK protein [Arcticibacter tournemirensis]